MSSEFIIDENIVYNTWRGKDAKDNVAIKERTFMYLFLSSDKLLAMTPYIQKQYSKISKTVLSDQQYMDAGFIPMFMQRLLDTTKSHIYDGLKPDYEYIKKGDDEFVCLAITRDGNLVTVDKRLLDEIKNEGLEGKVKYYDVPDAIPLLS